MKKSLAILFLVSSILPAFAGDDLSSELPCPDGGTKLHNTTICCKNGYASRLRFTSEGKEEYGEYTGARGECGCPNGGRQSKKNPAACCKNGFLWVDYQKDYTTIDYKSCGYPQEGYKPKGENTIGWCKDGYMWSHFDKSYSVIAPDSCGCPEGNKYNNGFCCRDGYRLYSEGDYRINFKACGCPPETRYGGRYAGRDVCCIQSKQGYALKNLTPFDGGDVSEELNIVSCGCPNNGKLVKSMLFSVNYFCCKDGYILDEETGLYSEKSSFCRRFGK